MFAFSARCGQVTKMQDQLGECGDKLFLVYDPCAPQVFHGLSVLAVGYLQIFPIRNKRLYIYRSNQKVPVCQKPFPPFIGSEMFLQVGDNVLFDVPYAEKIKSISENDLNC